MQAIAFTGLPGSGKSEAVSIAEQRGWTVIRMGDEVRAEARRRGMKPSDANLGRVADELRRQEGMDIWARRSLPSNPDDVVIDGIRNIEEVEFFRQRLDSFMLVAVHASPETRYQRLRARGRSDDAASLDELKQRDERELGWGIGGVVAMADVVVVNEGSLEELQEKVAGLLADIPA
ncbi:MAG: AAA family ATPase [Thermoplasmatota archaeon]